jgi:hypothetical protein
MATLIGIWIAAFLTLCIFSFLYRDNPFYRFAEHVYVGGSVAYLLIQTWYFTIQPKLVQPLIKGGFTQNYLLLIPAVLGIMILTRWFPNIGWMSRVPIAFTVGVGVGLGITGNIQGILIPQLRATIVPVNSWNNAIMIIGVITTISYFYFSREHKGVLGGSAKVGTIFIMIFFGATFGYTVMARVSLLIGRIHFLLHSWLHLI